MYKLRTVKIWQKSQKEGSPSEDVDQITFHVFGRSYRPHVGHSISDLWPVPTGEREPGEGERRPQEGGEAADGGGQVPVVGAEQPRAAVHRPGRPDPRAPVPPPPQQLPPAHRRATLPALTALWGQRLSEAAASVTAATCNIPNYLLSLCSCLWWWICLWP